MKNSSRAVRRLQKAINLADEHYLINQLRNRVFHPPYEAPWYGKVYGYAWRIGSVLGFIAIVSYGVLKRKLTSPAYRGILAEEIAKHYHATNVFCGKANSPMFGGGCIVSSVSADGAEGSFFKRLDAKGLEFDLGFQFIKTNWTIDLLSISEMNLDLRTGGMDPVIENFKAPAAKPDDPTRRVLIPEFKTGSSSPRAGHLLNAGFGFRPDFNDLKIKAFEAANVSLTWGFSTTTEGGVRKAEFASFHPADGGWRLVMKGGDFQQNWLKGLKLEDAEVMIGNETVTIAMATFTRGQQTTGTLQGKVQLGNMPQLDLDFEMKRLDLRQVTPEPLRKFFMATADLRGKAAGTLNHSKGLQASFHLQLVPPVVEEGAVRLTAPKPSFRGRPVLGYLTNQVAAIYSLSVASGEGSLALAPITGGSFDLQTGDGRMTVSNLDLECADLMRIRGGFTAREILVESSVKRVIGQEDKSAPTLNYECDANLRIGINPATVAAMPKPFQEKYFSQEEEGMRWMEVRTEKENFADFTKALSAEMAKVQQQTLINPGE